MLAGVYTMLGEEFEPDNTAPEIDDGADVGAEADVAPPEGEEKAMTPSSFIYQLPIPSVEKVREQ